MLKIFAMILVVYIVSTEEKMIFLGEPRKRQIICDDETFTQSKGLTLFFNFSFVFVVLFFSVFFQL